MDIQIIFLTNFLLKNPLVHDCHAYPQVREKVEILYYPKESPIRDLGRKKKCKQNKAPVSAPRMAGFAFWASNPVPDVTEMWKIYFHAHEHDIFKINRFKKSQRTYLEFQRSRGHRFESHPHPQNFLVFKFCSNPFICHLARLKSEEWPLKMWNLVNNGQSCCCFHLCFF